jgi:hypothetical protein
VGDLSIYSAEESACSLREVIERLEQFTRRNVLRRHALFYLSAGSCTLAFVDREASLSRQFPALLSVDDERLLSHLDLSRAGEFADPAAQFLRLLDRETLSAAFFRRFRSATERVAEKLRLRCPGEDAEAIHDHAMLLLSRLLFLSFIQEKGWLDHNRNFLSDRLGDSIRKGDDFYATTLLSLFFGCLNTPRNERDPSTLALGEIPYLNGGLFHPSPFELRNRIDLLDNDLLEEIIRTLFAAFQFTVDEQSTSALHIDPEMLGKVFESLMAGERRLTSGSFYTPRRVVDRLVQRSLIESLAGDDRELAAALAADTSDALRRIDRPRLLLLRQQLDEIRILDPACGSGAFLLGSLYALETLHERLAGALECEIPPGLRRRIVEESLFGVDINSEAVRLCELRLWLAIVAPDDHEIDALQPLPNLDRNIFQGNSLVDPVDALADAPLAIHRDWSIRLRQRHAALRLYRHGSRDEKRAALKQIRAEDQRIYCELLSEHVAAEERALLELGLQQSLLASSSPGAEEKRRRKEMEKRADSARERLRQAEHHDVSFFSYRVQFADVMEAGGFDCVVGNPPWVRHSRIDERDRRMLADRYSLFRNSGASFRQTDLAIVFYEKAMSLVKRGGSVSFLLPGKFLTAAYAAPLRRVLQGKHCVVAIDDWSAEGRELFSADTFPIGLTSRYSEAQLVNVASGEEEYTQPVAQLEAGRGSTAWTLAPASINAILRRCRERFPPLSETLGRAPLMGVKTGANARFFLDDVELRDGSLLHQGVIIPMRNVCRVIRGRDVQRWKASGSCWMIWSPNGRFDPRQAWLRELALLHDVEPAAFRLSYVRPEHLGTKVVWKDLATSMKAAAAPDFVRVGRTAVPLIPNQTTYFLDTVSLEEAHQLAALLNSSVANALLVSIAEGAKDGHFRFFGTTVAGLPLPSFDEESRHELARLARRAAAEDVSAELDRLVANRYELSPRELRALQRHFGVTK